MRREPLHAALAARRGPQGRRALGALSLLGAGCVVGALAAPAGTAPRAAAFALAAATASATVPPLVLTAPVATTITATATTTQAASTPVTATQTPLAMATGTPASTAAAIASATALAIAAGTTTTGRSGAAAGWRIRSVDTMKLSRDTLKAPLTDAQIAADIRLDARLHLTHVAVDVYYDDPVYLARWIRAVRASGLHVWLRAHWYAWEDHRDRRGSMSPDQYIEATRRFLQQHAALLENGDIFDFCAEPENGAYWLRTYGNGWSWRNSAAKRAFNSFIRSGVYMASTTLANRGRGGVQVTAISVDPSIAERMLSKPTIERLGMVTLDLYPEGKTIDPATATQRLLDEIAQVRRRWPVPVLLGEHGYARDMQVDDATQARVLTTEFAALARLPYVIGLNYWVDAGGPGYGGYTNLYRRTASGWAARSAATVLARVFGAMAQKHH